MSIDDPIELSLAATDLLWEQLQLASFPALFELPSIGETTDDRARLREIVYLDLVSIVVRPRGWHLDEKHILVDGHASGSLTDFALYMATSARRQLDKGKGPYFYLAKNEHYLEARMWNDAFNIAQDMLGIPRGTIRATVLIETIPAAFQMEEILYELRTRP